MTEGLEDPELIQTGFQVGIGSGSGSGFRVGRGSLRGRGNVARYMAPCLDYRSETMGRYQRAET